MKQPDDLATRTALLEELDTTFVVEAAAGTGKTTVLVGRIVQVVRRGKAALRQVIAVTFTEKAAGEMKLRLRDRLERARDAAEASPEERERLTVALEELEVARIGTIHGLCADLLREYPVEAQVDPLFEVAEQHEADGILDAAFAREFQGLVGAPPEGVRRMLRRRGRGFDKQSARTQLREAVGNLVERRDFAAPWRRDPFAREAAIDALLPTLEAFARRLPQLQSHADESWFLDNCRLVHRFFEDLRHRESVSLRDYDGLEAQLRELLHPRWTYAPYRIEYADGVTQAQVLADRDAAHAALEQFCRLADADLAACLHHELSGVVAAYERAKQQLGVLDFVDLLLKTRQLVQQHASVRASLHARFTHLFVDEFQDTDPLQSDLLLLLAADDVAVSEPAQAVPKPGKLFVVGDPKQSIYRFRRADVLLYQRVKAQLLRHGAQLKYLATSFRSTPGIQAAINGAFSPVMRGGHQADDVPLRPWREVNAEQPSLVALAAPRPLGQRGRPTKDAVEASVAEAVAAFIEWLVTQSGWKVSEGEQQVPVQARHVCILFKRLRGFGGADVPRPYAQALEARRVPHVLVGGRSFHLREEVMALRTALLAIERPDDELSVYATLRGPFFAFTDEQLLIFKHELSGKLHPLRPLEGVALSEGSQEVAAALGTLRELHRRRNRRPVAGTINALLEATRAHAGVAFWTAGAQALANVLQLAKLSGRHEKRASSFRDVIEALQEGAEAGEAPEAPVVEEGTEGVRMMTVHGAKGLEFPVVILADPLATASRSTPSHWVDPEAGLWVHALAGCVPSQLREHEAFVLERDREEAVRLSYVAVTRARDLLVVPVCSEKRWPQTWTSVLEPSVWPTPATAHQPQPAPGCPAFGLDVILDRQGPVPFEVPLPGLHRASTGKNRVVWWCPKTLNLLTEERTGLESSDALAEDSVEGPRSIAAWEAWQLEHDTAVAQGMVPSSVIQVARELPPVESVGQVPVEHTDVEREGRPKGRRFGELVHAALAVVPLGATPAQIAQIALGQARALQATEAERAAAVQAVASALRHPRFLAAAQALEVRREVAVVDFLPDGTVIEGAIDFAYRTAEGWCVLEFKTDEALDASRAQYEAQTLAYVRAIAKATGKPARGVLLRV